MFGGAPGSGSGGGFKASLGVVPDYNAEEIKGCRITGTSPGSPAAKAGLLDGDVLVQWDAHKIDSVFDLTDELRNAKPGNKVKLGVLRDGKRIDLEATLAEPKL
jgi:S1-C subfamily serine protease